MVAQAAALVALHRFFVGTELGQLVDTASLAGNVNGRDRILPLVVDVLNLVSVLSLAVATVAIGFIALARRRVGLALVAIMLIAGSNLTTQVLKKELFTRPDFDIDGVSRVANSLPSGHTTVAASVAFALVLVLPQRLRGIGGLIGAGYAALTGVATLSAGWHRPSDAVGSYLVVGAWAAFAGLLLTVLRRENTSKGTAHHIAVAVLGTVSGVLLISSALMLREISGVFPLPWRDFGDHRFLIAYVGGLSGIAGTACALMAIFLATVHRVVPRRTVPRQPGAPDERPPKHVRVATPA
jgi:membrane-associated phospholipid phosphatase